MKNSTKRRSVLARTLVLLTSMFSGNLKDTSGKNVSPRYASGTGWGGGAVFSPKRTKFKGYMRNTSTFNKNR